MEGGIPNPGGAQAGDATLISLLFGSLSLFWPHKARAEREGGDKLTELQTVG